MSEQWIDHPRNGGSTDKKRAFQLRKNHFVQNKADSSPMEHHETKSTKISSGEHRSQEPWLVANQISRPDPLAMAEGSPRFTSGTRRRNCFFSAADCNTKESKSTSPLEPNSSGQAAVRAASRPMIPTIRDCLARRNLLVLHLLGDPDLRCGR